MSMTLCQKKKNEKKKDEYNVIDRLLWVSNYILKTSPSLYNSTNNLSKDIYNKEEDYMYYHYATNGTN